MSKTRSLHHIVFATKNRQKTIPDEYKRELYSYILGIIRNRNCFLIRINGMSDHLHLLLDLHPSVALSDIVKIIKQQSCLWMRQSGKFPSFDSWGVGYYAMSIGIDGLEVCRQYIIDQENHHRRRDFKEEMLEIARAYGLNWHEEDLS